MPEDTIKPVGKLTPLIPRQEIKPVGELKPLNSDASYLEATGQLTPTTKPDPKIAQVWGDKKETGLGEDVYHSLARGSARLGSMLAKTPALIYDLAAQATDAIVNTTSKGINAAIGTDLKTDYETTSEKFAQELGLPENKIAKYYDEKVKKSQEISAQKYDKGITDYFGAGEYKKGFGLIANSVAESAPITISLLLGNAAGVPTTASILGGGTVFAADKKAELDREAPNMDHDTKMSIALSNGLFEGIFEQFGITRLAGLTKNVIAKEGKDAALRIAEEGFKDVYKPIAKKYLGVAAEESISEAATQFAQNAVDKYSGYKPELDIMHGVVDAGIVGLAAGSGYSAVPGLISASQAKSNAREQLVQRDAEQGRHALEVAQQGDEAVKVFKEQVNSELQKGNLTPEQANKAITRINSYKEYNDITTTLDLTEEKKLEVFDKTFQKQALETELESLGDPAKLHPLKQGEYAAKEKMANDLQKDINAIMLESQFANETTLGEKTINDLAKKEEKDKPDEKAKIISSKLQAFKDKFKDKIPKGEERSFEEFPVYEYNDSDKIKDSYKHKITTEWLDKQPEKSTYGTIAQRPFIDNNGNVNSVLGIEFAGGKKLRFGSSMEREEGHNGHFLIERFNNEVPKGTPIGIKVEEIPAFEKGSKARKTIKAFRADNGKFIGWMKETTRGTSDYSPEQQDALAHLETVVEPPLDLFNETIKPENNPAPVITPEKPTNNPEAEKIEQINKAFNSISESAKNAGLPDIIDKISKGKDVIFTKPASIESAQKNEYYNIEIQPDGSAKVIGVFNPETKTWVGKEKNTNLDTQTTSNEKPKLAESEAESDLALSNTTESPSTQSEPDIQTIERKAEGDSETELVEATKDSTGLIDSATDVVNVSIKDISTDESRFQNRDELDKDIVKSIAENFDENQFDPIVLWKQKDKTFVIAGHHRLEGVKQSGKSIVKARYFVGTEKQAIEFAKEKSNANRTLENPVERAKIYREKIARGESKKSVEDQAKQNEGKNASFYLNIAALNPQGMAIQTYNSLKQSEDQATKKEVDKILDWIGDVRRLYDLTDAHEQELFEFLFKNDASKRITTKSEFRQKVATIAGAMDFDASKPLNIARFKYKSEGEKQYDNETTELKFKIQGYQNQITDVKERFSNPKNPKYVSTEASDYAEAKKLADEKIVTLNEKIKNSQKKLQDLYQDKGNRTDQGSNQESLFDRKKGVQESDNTELYEELNSVVGRPASQVLEKISHLVKDENVKSVLDAMIKNSSKIDEFVTFKGFKNMENNGVYYPRTGELYLHKDLKNEASQEDFVRIVIHEYMHAFTTRALSERQTQQEKEFYESINTVFNELKKDTAYPEEYGFTNVHEFVSELSANPDFAEKIKANNKNIFQKIIEAIKKLFGIKTSREKLVEEGIESILSFIPESIPGKTTKVIKLNAEKINNKDFDYYRDKFLKRDVEEEQDNIKQIKEILKDKDITEEDKSEIEDLLDAIREQKEEDKERYLEYLEEKKQTEKIAQAEDFEKTSLEDLVKSYNFAKEEGEGMKDAALRIGVYLNHLGTERLSKIDKGIAEKANTKNFTFLEKWMKVLSNVSEYFPGLQELHKVFEEKYQDKVQEANKLKSKHEKLGKAVIKEKNGKLGLISDAFNSDSAKYFEFLDDGGKLRINSTGLTKAQKEYLDFIKDLVKDRNTIIDEDGNIVDNTLIRIDKGFLETFKSDGYKAAWTSLLPKTSDNTLNWQGALTSRFDRPYKRKSYSKDFYKAANIFIEDLTHVKYLKDVVPIADGIAQFYEKIGKEENKNFDNLIGFIKEWKKSKLYQESGKTDPRIDIPLRFLRSLVSTSVMGFNMDANFMNVVIGNINTIVKDGIGPLKKGLERMATDREKAMAILKHYDVVKTDFDSNPKTHLGKLFENMAFIGLRLGEVQIQGAAFLGKLSKEEYDNIEVKDGEVTVKSDKKEFDSKMRKYKNEVTDVQGKYGEKDKSNALNYEFAKALLQFKVYAPAFWKDKFGPEFINSYGETKRGTFNYTKKAWQELKDDWTKNGFVKGTWENKQTMSNLKYAAIIAALTILTHADDDEDEKKKINSLDNALSSMLFVFDPQQMKYLVSSPVAAQGPVTKLIDALTAAYNGDEKKFSKNAKKLVPFYKVTEIPKKVEKALK